MESKYLSRCAFQGSVVSLSDNDTKIELQAHSVTGKDHDFALKIGMRFYVFSCSGLFMAKVKREIRVAKVGNTTLRDARIFLLKGDDQAENPSAVAATRVFVLSSAPYDASANRVTNKDETQTETYEVQSGSSKTPLGTSSSPVTARMGTGLAIGGVTGTSGGKVYVQFIKQGTMPHCTLQRVADTSALSSALYCLATSASDQAKPSYFGALTSGRTYKGGSKAKEQASAIEDLDIETLAEELSSEGLISRAGHEVFVEKVLKEASSGIRRQFGLIDLTIKFVMACAILLTVRTLMMSRASLMVLQLNCLVMLVIIGLR